MEATSLALGFTPLPGHVDVDEPAGEDLLVGAIHQLQRQAGSPALLVTKVGALPLETFGMAGHALAARPTLAEGVQSLSRYLGLLSPALGIEIRADGPSTRLSLPSGEPATLVSSAAAHALFVQIARLARRDGHAPLSTTLRQELPPERALYDEAFGCPVEFGSERDAIVIPSAALAIRLPSSDGPVGAAIRRGVGRALRRLVVVGPVSVQVREAIVELLPAGIPSMTRVASRLGTTVPLLSALLREEAQSFADLRESLLHELCRQFLEDPDLAIVDVAFVTGFVERDVFERSFERWSGQHPSAFRAVR